MEASLERRAALDAARDVRRLEMLATNAQARAGLRILFSEARRHGLGVSFAGVSLQAQSSQSGAGSHAAVPPSPARPRDAQHRAPSPAAAPPAGAPATSRKSRRRSEKRQREVAAELELKWVARRHRARQLLRRWAADAGVGRAPDAPMPPAGEEGDASTSVAVAPHSPGGTAGPGAKLASPPRPPLSNGVGQLAAQAARQAPFLTSLAARISAGVSARPPVPVRGAPPPGCRDERQQTSRSRSSRGSSSESESSGSSEYDSSTASGR